MSLIQQVAPPVIGIVVLIDRSQSVTDDDTQTVYPITFEVFFQSACPILNCFQWSLPRQLCVTNQSRRQLRRHIRKPTQSVHSIEQ